MAGDALKSLVKRARGFAPGSRWPPMDQLDFVVGALLLMWPWVDSSLVDVTVILIFSFVADLVVNRIAFSAGIKHTPW